MYADFHSPYARLTHMFVVNIWAEPREAEEIDERMVKVKADLLSELVAVSVYLLLHRRRTHVS